MHAQLGVYIVLDGGLHIQLAFERGLGAQVENEQLRAYYPDRTAWLLEPDARPPKLSPYISIVTPEPVTAAPSDVKPTSGPKKKPTLKFEEVK